MPEGQAMEKARRMVEEKLGVTPVSADTLIAQTGLPAGLVQSALLEMELAGRVQRFYGGRVSLMISDALGVMKTAG